MTDVAQHSTQPSAPRVARPALAVVQDELVTTRATADAGDASTADTEPNVGRTGMIGYAIGFTVATVGITIAGTLGGLGFGPSLGLGAFVGFWGGGGFGFMLGATIPFARYLDAQSAHSHRQGDTPQ